MANTLVEMTEDSLAPFRRDHCVLVFGYFSLPKHRYGSQLYHGSYIVVTRLTRKNFFSAYLISLSNSDASINYVVI